MKNKIFIAIVFILIFLIFFGFCYYKFRKNGNNIIIQNAKQAEEFILNISSYEAEIEVTVDSNKNSNTYKLKQFYKDNYIKQEVLNGELEGVNIEYKDNNLKVTNSKLNVSKIYENYDFVMSNSLFLTTFINEYKQADNKEIKEENDCYVFSMKIKNQRNKYIAYKYLYMDKNTNKPAKLIIKDVNQNRTIYILYNMIQF